MNENIDLVKILKDCPRGTKFWSPLYGEVEPFITHSGTVKLKLFNGDVRDIYSDGTIYLGKIYLDRLTTPEIMLYPSKDQRDWSKFNAPWLKKERFDPKTLKPFDKVLVRVFGHHIWKVDFYSHKGQGKEFPYICVGNTYKYCIPYNDDTKHLIGTTDEAPKFYRHLED